MDDQLQINKPVSDVNPTELLSAQARTLAELVEIQKTQTEQIAELQRQNERAIGLLADRNLDVSGHGLTRVKIEGVNMPFGALVGFLVKVSLATIPAFLFLGALYVLIGLILTAVFGATWTGLF